MKWFWWRTKVHIENIYVWSGEGEHIYIHITYGTIDGLCLHCDFCGYLVVNMNNIWVAHTWCLCRLRQRFQVRDDWNPGTRIRVRSTNDSCVVNWRHWGGICGECMWIDERLRYIEGESTEIERVELYRIFWWRGWSGRWLIGWLVSSAKR